MSRWGHVEVAQFLYDHGPKQARIDALEQLATPRQVALRRGLARVLERDADLARAILGYMCGCGSDLRA